MRRFGVGTRVWWHYKGDDRVRQPAVVEGHDHRRRALVRTVGQAQCFDGVRWHAVLGSFAQAPGRYARFGGIDVVRPVMETSLRVRLGNSAIEAKGGAPVCES